jgi:cellulose synthase/poly-beta-1,6-N-acetylglucosamine synthase-like glycosyltransferase
MVLMNKMNDLTILIVCFENDDLVDLSINENYGILSKYPIVVIDKKGGDRFVFLNQAGNTDIQYFYQDSPFWSARKFGLEFVTTKYVLCLDVDTILPQHYIEDALCILESRPDVACIAINYEPPHHQSHLAFGTSIWRTDILKKLYDWYRERGKDCECRYMWKKVESEKMKVETLPIEAKHLKNPI